MDLPSDFTAPVYQSLTSPVLMGGVPRTLAILNGMLTATLVLNLHQLWALPVGLALHGLAVLLTRYDPQFVDVLRTHVRYRTYYAG
jgi:type IV secretion system protein VirB3